VIVMGLVSHARIEYFYCLDANFARLDPSFCIYCA